MHSPASPSPWTMTVKNSLCRKRLGCVRRKTIFARSVTGVPRFKPASIRTPGYFIDRTKLVVHYFLSLQGARVLWSRYSVVSTFASLCDNAITSALYSNCECIAVLDLAVQINEESSANAKSTRELAGLED